MEIVELIPLVTIVVTLICGVIAKKVSWFNNKLIPIQNLVIGLIIAVIEWIITKDFKTAVAVSGLLAGGTYDLANNLKKIFDKKEVK